MLDFINQIIYNYKELKGEDDGNESLNNLLFLKSWMTSSTG